MEEIWKTIEGFEDYQVSNLGRFKSLSKRVRKCYGFRVTKSRVLKQCINGSGYYQVVFSSNSMPYTRQIHQLVAIAFLNHKQCGHKFVVNHKDFNKLNNNIDNLEIVTHRENSNRKHLKSTSEYTGVSWHKNKKKWVASICINGSSKHLGCFIYEIEAHNAYQNKLQEIKLNFEIV